MAIHTLITNGTSSNLPFSQYIGPNGQLAINNTIPPQLVIHDGSTPGGNAIGSLQLATVRLSSSQLLNCQSTPVTVIPSPGPNKIIVVNSATYILKYGTSAYNGDGSALWWGTSVTADTGSGGVFSQGGDSIQQSLPYAAFYETPSTFGGGVIENVPITFWSPNSALSGGDGTGILYVLYYIISAN